MNFAVDLYSIAKIVRMLVLEVKYYNKKASFAVQKCIWYKELGLSNEPDELSLYIDLDSDGDG